MRSLYLYFSLSLFLVLVLQEAYVAQSEKDGVYIVYMGASHSADGSPRHDHSQLLSLMKRKKNPVKHSYSNGFSGFAVRLSGEEAKSIAQRPGVVSVFPDPVLKLHTTHSWEFLKYQTSVKIDSSPAYPSGSSSGGADTIIGVLDTGIWPESESFDDKDVSEIPTNWKGKCMEGKNFTTKNCNKKIIGARYYDDPDSGPFVMGTPRDEIGHGTHVASTAAGGLVSKASFYGLAEGTAVGGSTGSRIAMYRVCQDTGCLGSAILKAFDDAIGDGVNVLSLSLGSSPGEPNFITDPIAIGAFHAMEKGIIVACSAGNSGPFPSSVVNVAPWILTVAATTIDRDLEAKIMLGGNKTIKGGGINFSGLNKSPNYPLIAGSSAKSNTSDIDASDARNCVPGSLDDSKVKGKIVLCENNDGYSEKEKYSTLKNQGAVGIIVIDNNLRQVPSKYGTSPIAIVTEDDRDSILSYINSSSDPLATILPTAVVLNYKPAPVVGYFSSRGPVPGIKNLIKPDITAPGVAILAAWPANDNDEALPGKEPPQYNILSGTSMSCPHVSGLAAAIKSQHPTWSPSAIRSAIMTTAIQTNNLHAPITTNMGSIATPYDVGAGEISVSGPLEPGLVYETEVIDYLQFLCNSGYDTAKIKNISQTIPSNFACPTNPNSDSISNMNYPSIAISNLKQNEIKTVNRTVTNVGEQDSTYTAIVEAPANVHVEVVPSKLQFSNGFNKLTFQVTFKLTAAPQESVFGSITWSATKYKVRSPFVVVNG
ncbi:CO(2)-response secreted protease [Andrographis paniculata]|uniref:CO(2)-response secreted protease n=1 Tax=Andrographis paniculata TaxID=175694 RepID=UPI0021E881B7|nr:CO(2)-response secreted protease [Andrographis paniculata]